MVPLSRDTSPEAERVLVELWRRATPARKFSIAFDTSRTMQEFLLAGLRERHPNDTPEQLRRRFADAWLGPELARHAYGAPPDDTERSGFLDGKDLLTRALEETDLET
jgi:hypothetical protein